MIDINTWINEFLLKLNNTFKDRIWFVGLQGSYSRGEATNTSDIDMVVILDQLSTTDIKTYSNMLDSIPNRELICGFISGKEDIMNWEPSDLFQFCNDTTPIIGSLDEVINNISDEDINRAIRIGACNIFHSCVHNMVHEKSDDILKGLYKSASFVVQAIVFKQTGKYFRNQEALLKVAKPMEQAIIKNSMNIKKGNPVDFTPMSETLFTWSKYRLSNLAN